jgi:hypothetical protein
MEMMQMQSAGPSGTPPMSGKMPATTGNEHFRTLLNRQQAAVLGKKVTEEGDPAVLACWLPPGLSADVMEWRPAAGQDEHLENVWLSSLSLNADHAAAGEGPGRGAEMGFSGIPGQPALASRQAEGADKLADFSGHAPSAEAVMKNSRFVLPGLSTPALDAATVRFGQTISDPSPLAESHQQLAGDSNVPVGILERRFTDMLRSGEAVFTRSFSGSNHPVLHAPTLAGELTSAVVPEAAAGEAALRPEGISAVADPLEQEDFPLSGAPRQEALSAAGLLPGDRIPAPAILSPATEGAVLKQPFGTPASESQILDQVVSRMAVERNQDVSRMSIKLQPPRFRGRTGIW